MSLLSPRIHNKISMLKLLQRTDPLSTKFSNAAPHFTHSITYSPFQPRAMSSQGEKAEGMATEGLPKGPDIEEHTQKQQPGIQSEMETKPELTRLPTQHGHDEVLKLEEYVGVGKLKVG